MKAALELQISLRRKMQNIQADIRDKMKVNEEWDKFDDMDYFEFTTKWIEEADKLLRERGSIMVCCSSHNLGEVIMVLKNLKYKFLNLPLALWLLRKLLRPNHLPQLRLLQKQEF